MTCRCPQGHESADADYCSECGARIQAEPLRASPAVAPVANSSASGAEACPDCATARPAGARFCEVCRYDFQSRTSFNTAASPAARPATAPAPAASPACAPSSPAVAATKETPAAARAAQEALPPKAEVPASRQPATTPPRLQLRVMVDPSINTDPDPNTPCPVGQPDRLFHLDLEENVLGRQYEGKGSHPEIVVNDPGISRRHLKFLRAAGGEFTVLELGSSNGTQFNGKPLDAGMVHPVQTGDVLILGMWTRITVETR